MSGDFRREFGRVDSGLVTMAKAVRESMRQASSALLTADHSQAQQVAARAEEIDVLYRVVEDRVYDLIAGHRPPADDLRVTLTALELAADLKRMGALAVLVARATLRRQPLPAVVAELAALFRAMITAADALAAKIVLALAGHDTKLAAELDGDDDVMDQLHRELFAVLLSPDWPMGTEAAVDGALLGRYYERYADHAVNIGRHVIALAPGNPT